MGEIIKCNEIKIEKSLARHKIVREVVDTFIKTEYQKKGKGVEFWYPVEDLPGNKQLFIVRPGHKKNFDFRVEVTYEMGLAEGTHAQIALDLRGKRIENQQKFEVLLDSISKIYHCSENNVNRLLGMYPDIQGAFRTGGEVEVILKIVKWLFIMEDISIWNN